MGRLFGKHQVRAIVPTLETFFGIPSINAPHFVAAVRASQLKAFDEGDAAWASKLIMRETDDGRRLLSLATQSRLPEAIDAWIWDAIERLLRARLPGALDADDVPMQTLRSVKDALAGAIRSIEASHRQRAVTLLLLALTWLIRTRSLEPVNAIQVVRDVFVGTPAHGERVVRAALSSGKASEVQRIVAMYNLLDPGSRPASQDARTP